MKHQRVLQWLRFEYPSGLVVTSGPILEGYNCHSAVSVLKMWTPTLQQRTAHKLQITHLKMTPCAMITALSTARLIWRCMEATWSTQRDLWWELKDKLNANQASIWKESLSVARRQIWFVHPPIMDLSGVLVNMTHSPVVKSWKGKFEFMREASKIWNWNYL